MTGPTATHGRARPRLLLLAGYVLALALVFMPILETFAALWPPQPDNTGWRFGATGIFFTFVTMAPLGLLVAITIASIQRQRTALRALATFSLVLAVVIAILFGSFSLDFIQVRPMIQPRVKGGFDAAAAKATVTAILSLVSCMILALAGFRDSRELGTIRRPRRAPAEDVVIGRLAR
jgi:MFS family permease